MVKANDLVSNTKWGAGRRLLFVVNETYFFYSHRLALARAAREAGFEIHVAAPADHVWAPDSFDITALAAEGFVYHAIPLYRRGINPLQDLRTFWALWRLYRRLRPSLIHHLTIKPVLYGGILARIMGDCGVLNAITGLGHIFSADSWRSKLLRGLIIRLYRLSLANRSSRTVVQNPDDGAQLVALGAISKNRVDLIRGSGVSLTEYTPHPESDGPALVILPARLIWAKGVGEFVAAAKQLRGEGLAARFALLGGAKKNYTGAVSEAQLRQIQDQGIVEWWGHREDMVDIYQQCHVVCLPTTYGEGVPRVLIEAAASGRAIVTTDVAGCRDIVVDGVNGRLVPPGDSAALADALRGLLQDAPLRRQLGAAGRDIARRGFSVESVVEQTLEVYRQLLHEVTGDEPA